MSKKMRTGLKKSVSMIVAVTTIVWLSGLAILLTPAITIVADERPSVVVGGVTVYDGDLISSNATNPDGTPTYASLDIYIAKVVSATETYKRLVLNPQVFDSYGHLNWGDVQEVSQTVMDAFTTSCLTREDGDTKVYAMAPDDDTGTKSWVNLTETEFIGATVGSYSSNDADAIYTINSTDAGNYTATGDLTTVSAFETYLTAGTLPAVSGAGTGLTVALSSATPASASIIADSSTSPTTAGAQAMVPMTAVNFTAANDGDVIVSTVKFKRGGIPSADVDFSAFYLYDGSEMVAEYTSISSGVLTFTKSAGLFTVSAGTTKTLTLKMDVAEDLAASRTSKWSIVDATYVDAGTSVVSGTFPIDGNQMSSAVVADLGNITIANSSPTANNTVNAGELDFEMWRFSLVAEGQDMEISYLKFTNVGTVDNVDDIQNITLKKNDSTQYGTTLDSFESDGTLTFDLSANPITVLKGNTDYYAVRGDIIGGTNRTFRLSVQQMYHIVAKDKEYGVYTKANLADSWTVIQSGGTTTVNAGTMTVSRNTASPSGNVPMDGTNVEVAKIDFAAVGENVKISSLPIKVTETTDSVGTANEGLYQVKAYVDGSQIGSTTNLTADATAQTFSFGNNFIVPAGETKTLVLKADIKDGTAVSFDADDSFTVTVNAGTASGVVSLEAVTLTEQAGHLLTVSSNALSTAKNASFAEGTATIPNGVPGSSDVRVGSAVITAGAAEGVDITSISLTEKTGDDPFSSLQNVVMKKADGTQIGTAKASVTADGTYTFTPSSVISLAASESIVIDIFAGVKSSATAGDKGQLTISLVSGAGVTTGRSANDTTGADLQTVWIVANGSLTTTLDGATPSSIQLVTGSADNHIATFNVEETTGAEDVTLTKILVKNSTAADNTLINWALYDGETGAQIGTTVPVSATGVITFNSISWKIPAGTVKTFKVKVGVASYTTSVENTANYASLLNGNSAAFEGTGEGSGNMTITVGSSDINANSIMVYRTVLTAVGKTSSNPGGAYGASQEIAKIGLTASSNYNAKLVASTTIDDETDSFTGNVLTTSTSTTKIDGTNSIEITEHSTSATSHYAYLTTAVTAGLLDDYSKVSFWIRTDTAKEAAGDLTFNIDDATDMSATTNFEGSIPALAVNVWTRVEFDLSTVGSTALYVGIHIASGPDDGAVILLDDIRFYNDSLNLDISGNLGAVATAEGLAVYLKDASSTTKMTGYVYPTSTSAATVLFIPGSSDITIGNTEQIYSAITNTSTLMADDTTDDQSLMVNIDLGDVSNAGDFRWYDGAITATSPITWVTGSTPITFSFSY